MNTVLFRAHVTREPSCMWYSLDKLVSGEANKLLLGDWCDVNGSRKVSPSKTTSDAQGRGEDHVFMIMTSFLFPSLPNREIFSCLIAAYLTIHMVLHMLHK